MEFVEVIRQRRTIRDFSNQEIPFEIIKNALEAGIMAPSYNHLRQWDFILVRDNDLRIALTQTEEMVEEITEDLLKAFDGYENIAREMYLNAIPKQKAMILTAPEVLVIVYKPKNQVDRSNRIYDLNCLASVWCCIENILLSLCENNVFGVTFIPKNTDLVKIALNIPKDLEVAAIIPIGYKAENSKVLNQKYIDLNTKIHINRW